jgi:pilus assembly protein CpaC
MFFLSLKPLAQEAAAVLEKNIEIVLGIDKIIKLDFAPSTKVQVGNESFMTYQLIPQKKEITLKGVKTGKTSVTIRNTVGDIKAKYLVNITATDQSKVVQELREFLGDVEGLEIGIKGNQVYVGGNIVVPTDIGKVVVVLEKYENVVRLVELSPHTQRIIAKKMQTEIQKNNMRDVTVRVVNGLFWLEGIVTSEGLKTKAYSIASAYIPPRIESLADRTGSVQAVKGRDIIQNFININQKKAKEPVPKLIKITAQFVELTKDYSKVFGFKWEPTLAGTGGSIGIGKTAAGGVTTTSSNTLTATISNLFPKLGSAKNAGHARIIQSGVVVTKNNTTGKISKNSKKQFQFGTSEFTRTGEATAGFNMTVTPKILPGEKIDMNMFIGVSANIGDPPETLSNSISTSLVVKSKDSAVVGGIVVSKSATSFDKTPPDGKTEVEDGTALFSFLRSKDYSTSKSQFAVFITPEIIESAATGTEEIKRKFKRRRR